MGFVLAGCTSNDFWGDTVTAPREANDSSIHFGLSMQNATRADISGSTAASLLGGNFYVTATKGTESSTSPSPTLVIDNYLVHYTDNTAGTTTSNSANWEYVGITPGVAPYADWVKLSALNSQSIKYWDYSAGQYDFLAFSTGANKAVAGTSGAADEVGVTAMKYGAGLAGSAVAYSFDIPSVSALRQTYITDITEVKPASYGKEVTLRFKNLGSKVRIALYETVPGYAVKDVSFYQVDGTTDFNGAKSTTAALISAAGLPVKGTIDVFFPYVGTENESAEAYNRAAATVTAASSEGTEPYQSYGTLDNFAASKEGYEADGSYLGRTLPTATFAGSAEANYYTTVFPVSTSGSLTLRVNYTLVSADGSGEEIHVYGAKAVVPSTYTEWQPNYAYTYIFKISDNTNGWTDAAATAAGLFPITFDAVVKEATDVTGQQTTLTTVATPSVTVYQQNNDMTSGEVSVTNGKDVYIQVMDNSTDPATLVTGLSAETSLVYSLSSDATEAEVLDALLMRTSAVSDDDVTGRNGLVLIKEDVVDNTVTSIVNGADDNPISVFSGTASKIGISSLSADKSYAYVYVSSAPTEETNQFVQVSVTAGSAISGSSSGTFWKLTKAAVEAGETLAAAEAPDEAYVYFSVADNGTGSVTYSYINPLGATTIPSGSKKVAKTTLISVTGDATAETNTFYFESFITNNGRYVAKVINTTTTAPVTPASTDALTFEAKEAGATVTFTKATFVANQIEYSTDGGTTWATYSGPITLANVGDKVSFRGNNAAYATSSEASRFSCSKGCYIYGNIMSLINPTGYATATVLTEPYTFARMFENGNNRLNLYNHPTEKLVLPATMLSNDCYLRMFFDCSSLTTAPELPATTLADRCYESMFELCDNLTTAPKLPATTLSNRCYFSMFNGCVSLTTAPELPAITLSYSCYNNMFSGCTSLTIAPELPATTLSDLCYENMFNFCTSLTTAPELPATSLNERCYYEMFSRCTSLTTAPTLPATTLADYCYDRMFFGCTSLTTAPALLATTLGHHCYSGMFNGCTSLSSVKCLATDISAVGCTSDWLKGVSATGTFTKAAGMTGWPTGDSGIPSGWTVEEE